MWKVASLGSVIWRTESGDWTLETGDCLGVEVECRGECLVPLNVLALPICVAWPAEFAQLSTGTHRQRPPADL